MADGYEISLYDYHLPEELIAKDPANPRDSSRLLIFDKKTGGIADEIFRNLPEYLRPGDLIVVNDTKVFPARLLGRKPSGGKAEIFLLEKLETGNWTALVKPGRRLGEGAVVEFGEDFSARILERLPDGRREIELIGSGDIWSLLEKHGHTPLPVYIDRNDRADDVERYQTVYAKNTG
ncbi:MAG TPA: S-adenosylmethionine:tRNA ribosyltransferase-isomerase, partial [candidate division Zixibacteria bacterium]|nr:S-adenosylmethionine:tRNA ribosyltransferase-isomerase [candidate division Zixibacteria bacterium]